MLGHERFDPHPGCLRNRASPWRARGLSLWQKREEISFPSDYQLLATTTALGPRFEGRTRAGEKTSLCDVAVYSTIGGSQIQGTYSRATA